jgi:hypothetical protein
MPIAPPAVVFRCSPETATGIATAATVSVTAASAAAQERKSRYGIRSQLFVIIRNYP